MYFHTCLKTPGNFLNFPAEIGLELYGNMTVVYCIPRFQTNIFPFFMMFATQKEG